MKHLYILLASFLAVQLTSCTSTPKEDTPVESQEAVEAPKSDLFYHYSIWYAFVNRIFDGELTSGELKTKGDMALGSFDLLDGELIMLDGILYRATQDGVVHIVDEAEAKVAYVNAAFFDNEKSFKLDSVGSYDELRQQINSQLPSRNIFYAFKITGDFKKMKCGGLHKQEKPFNEGLDVLIPNRPIFERENFKGTMVGFFCPDFIGEINVAGYHLHFVSDDQQFAGHVMEFEAANLEIQMDMIYQYQFDLPTSKEYLDGAFDKTFQYQKK